jgi:DNA-directed RNA polymerase subunit beta'
MERWAALCPREFRTITEGGQTDVDRLTREFPKLSQVIAHDLSAGQGLIVRGKSGHGKTRSVWRLLRRAFDAGKTIRALTSGDFDRQARDAGGTGDDALGAVVSSGHGTDADAGDYLIKE